jgi:NAD(P)-dependent dehydrogenase (short-subunit alcohol dehydrogenase family)
MSAKIALVTGAGSGIGRAAALALQKVGFTVVLAGRRASELSGTAEMGVAGANPMLTAPADVSDPDSVRSLFEVIRERFGRLNLLFNNAGIGAPGVAFDELTDDDWLRVVNVNLNGAFFCAREAVRMMKLQNPQGGRIINNGSISAYVPRPDSAPYTATKHAITGLTKSLSLDGRSWNIACGQIDIGNAATEMTGRMQEGVPQADGTKKPEPRINVKHVADAIVYMASLPLDANVQFITVMATAMPYIGRG